MKAYFYLMILFSCLISVSLNAQIDLKGKVKNQSNNRANHKVDQGVDKSLDAVETGVKDLFKKKKKTAEGEPTGETGGENDPEAQPTEVGDTKPAAVATLEAYSRFDFIPGQKVVFYEDFSQDAVGDFPALWNTNGSAEVVTTNLYPGNWMKFNGRNSVWTDALLQLPDNYTIEFDIVPIKGEEGDRMSGYDFRIIQSTQATAFDHGAVPGEAGFLFSLEYTGRPGYRTYINSEEGNDLGMSGYRNQVDLYEKEDHKYHISLWVQKARVRLYQNEVKLFDLPKAFPLPGIKMDRIRFEEGSGMVSNIRIAVGAPDTRNKLMTDGKLVTYGIYFDVNNDVVKPESYGTLKEIAGILNEMPDVKVKIFGHTDADGEDAKNMDLSKRRAAAVKAELVKSFGVSTDRLETDGSGETEPVAPNDTPANKALNRRVEFIKL